jgi:hypothetical protein
MSLQLLIPDELAAGLAVRAAAVGTSAEEVALSAIERELAAASVLDQLLTPVREAYLASGMSEDESLDFLEAEKHAMRQERRAAQK